MNRVVLFIGVILLVMMLLPWSGYATHNEIATEAEIATTQRGTKYLTNLKLDQLLLGLLPLDAIPPIDAPEFTPAIEADTWLTSDDFVMGVRYRGITKAYPIRILNRHEIVNDDFFGEAIVVTYCPLCNSGLAFLAPEIDGQIVRFGNSGGLYQSDLLMYDRVTRSLWSQITGEAIVGRAVGEVGELHRIPVDIVPWGLWRDEHPDTLVLTRPKTVFTPQGLVQIPPEIYDDNSSEEAYRSQDIPVGTRLPSGVLFNDGRLRAMDDVIGVIVDGSAKAYAKTAFDEQLLLNDWISETSILAVKTPAGELKFFDRQLNQHGRTLEFELVNGRLIDIQTQSVWSFHGEALSGELVGAQLEEIVGIPSFWFAWTAFHPETELFKGTEPES